MPVFWQILSAKWYFTALILVNHEFITNFIKKYLRTCQFSKIRWIKCYFLAANGQPFWPRLVPKKIHNFSGAFRSKIFRILLEKLWENIENITKLGPYGAIYNFTSHLWSANENLTPNFEKYPNFGCQKAQNWPNLCFFVLK